MIAVGLTFLPTLGAVLDVLELKEQPHRGDGPA